jgi:hypothetical protein
MNVHVTLSLPHDKLVAFDAWWKAEGFTSRSAAVAYLISQVKPKKDDYDAPY